MLRSMRFSLEMVVLHGVLGSGYIVKCVSSRNVVFGEVVSFDDWRN